MGFAEDDIVVSFVSRLVWEKELGTYIRTVRRMQQQNPKVRALVVGDGPAKEEAQIQLPNGVFTGFCSGEALLGPMQVQIYFCSLPTQKLLVM